MLYEVVRNLDGFSLVMSLIVFSCLAILGFMACTAQDKGYRAGFYDGFKKATVNEKEADPVAVQQEVRPVSVRKVKKISSIGTESPRQSIAESIKRKARSSRR